MGQHDDSQWLSGGIGYLRGLGNQNETQLQQTRQQKRQGR